MLTIMIGISADLKAQFAWTFPCPCWIKTGRFTCRVELERLERFFTVLPETPALYPAWKHLLIANKVSGKPAHDARLVAAIQVHGLKAYSIHHFSTLFITFSMVLPPETERTLPAWGVHIRLRGCQGDV